MGDKRHRYYRLICYDGEEKWLDETLSKSLPEGKKSCGKANFIEVIPVKETQKLKRVRRKYYKSRFTKSKQERR